MNYQKITLSSCAVFFIMQLTAMDPSCQLSLRRKVLTQDQMQQVLDRKKAIPPEAIRRYGLPVDWQDWTNAFVLSPDTRSVYTDTNDSIVNPDVETTLQKWDFDTTQPLGEAIEGGTCPWVRALCISPDEDMAVSIDMGQIPAFIHQWDLKAKSVKTLAILDNQPDFAVIGGLALDKKATLVAAWTKLGIDLIDIQNKQRLGTLQHGGTEFVFSPDGNLLSNCYEPKDYGPNNQFFLWNPHSRELLQTYTLKDHDAFIYYLNVNPQNTQQASICAEGPSSSTLCLWDLQSAKELFSYQPPDETPFTNSQPSYSPDGNLIAVVCNNWANNPRAALLVWDARTDEKYVKKVDLEINWPNSPFIPVKEVAVFDPEGKTIAFMTDNGTSARLDVGTGKPILQDDQDGKCTIS